MASTYLTRSISSGSDLTKFTYSVWIKRSSFGSYQRIFSSDVTDSKDMYIRWQNSDELNGYHRSDSSTTVFAFETNAKYRDANAWYHLVIKFDSTQSTQADRLKVYVNGEEPSMSSITYPSQNQIANFMNSGEAQDIGYYRTSSGEYFDGLMSHIHFTAGYAYDASTFGSTDSTTGEWKINTSPNVTYGSLGYFILKDGNSITDQSTNSNNFTVGGGTLTKTEDCPSNVFCTGNSLNKGSNVVLASGNNNIRNDQNTDEYAIGTIATGTGKYYWETYKHGGGTNGIGICLSNCNHTPTSVNASRIMYLSDGTIYKTAWSLSDASVATFSHSDIVGVSLDTENGILKFYKNGTLVDTTTNSILQASNNEFIPMWYVNNGGESRANMGNGYFGTTAVSSAGTNASGIGIFEYDVPTGYTALSTKGLNT